MRGWLLIIGLIATGMLAGCTGYNTGLVAQEWGTSQKLAIANQTLNPGAEKNLEPVQGLDNKAADKVVNKYNKEFERAPQVPVYNLQLPGTMGSSTSTGTYY